MPHLADRCGRRQRPSWFGPIIAGHGFAPGDHLEQTAKPLARRVSHWTTGPAIGVDGELFVVPGRAHRSRPNTRRLKRLPWYRHNRSVANRFPAVDALILDVETIAADQTDPLAVLILLMQMLIRSEVDPYLLNGALIEGIAATIMQRIPAEKRGEASLEAMRLLRDQLRSHGAI